MPNGIQNMTKEERDEFSKQKMKEMKIKNEAFQKRYEEVEADRLLAEQCNSSVTIPFASNYDATKPKQRYNEEEWRAERKKIDEQRVARNSGNVQREWDMGKSDHGIEEPHETKFSHISNRGSKQDFSVIRSRKYEEGRYARDQDTYHRNSKFGMNNRMRQQRGKKSLHNEERLRKENFFNQESDFDHFAKDGDSNASKHQISRCQNVDKSSYAVPMVYDRTNKHAFTDRAYTTDKFALENRNCYHDKIGKSGQIDKLKNDFECKPDRFNSEYHKKKFSTEMHENPRDQEKPKSGTYILTNAKYQSDMNFEVTANQKDPVQTGCMGLNQSLEQTYDSKDHMLCVQVSATEEPIFSDDNCWENFENNDVILSKSYMSSGKKNYDSSNVCQSDALDETTSYHCFKSYPNDDSMIYLQSHYPPMSTDHLATGMEMINMNKNVLRDDTSNDKVKTKTMKGNFEETSYSHKYLEFSEFEHWHQEMNMIDTSRMINENNPENNTQKKKMNIATDNKSNTKGHIKNVLENPSKEPNNDTFKKNIKIECHYSADHGCYRKDISAAQNATYPSENSELSLKNAVYDDSDSNWSTTSDDSKSDTQNNLPDFCHKNNQTIVREF